MRHGTLIATPPEGYPQISILPFVKTADEIELHMVQQDPTFAAVRAGSRVTFLVSEFLAFTPHDFVDPADPGKATLHFRAAAFECDVVSLSTEPDDVRGALERLLAHHEGDRSHPRIPEDDARLRMLAALRLRVVAVRAKFKTGPAGDAQLKRQVAALLRERGEPGDGRAADVIESYLGAS
jgi:putative FMN-binding protein